ncbi:MAG: cytochrome c biogenesis protein CcsA [Bacteroidales bacterium]|nr:cytochrome c biogenesis protein CcsA [Bacteroidales bacterium]
MSWSQFPFIAIPALLIWIAAAMMAWNGRRGIATTLCCCGLLVYSYFIGGMWVNLERPPMRTMGETRLWYVFFLNVAGLITYLRWSYRWIPSFSALLSTVFTCVNLFKPEIHDKAMMPALQSGWFVPHVTVYMFAYALLASAFLMAIYLLFIKKTAASADEMAMTDNLTYIGLAFLTIGMLFGALWAKVAWGHYWTWDPKETWAAVTWFIYLGYIHYRRTSPADARKALVFLIVGFAALQVCWWGINYLPSAQGTSVHTYAG